MNMEQMQGQLVAMQPHAQSNGIANPTDELKPTALSPKDANVEPSHESKIQEMAAEHGHVVDPYTHEEEEEEEEEEDVAIGKEEDDEDVDEDETEDEDSESLFSQRIPNRVIVARNHPLSYYADRARRIVRMEKQLFVLGRGNTISMACTLVEVLKRQKIAVMEKVSTGMYVEPFFNSSGDPQWSQPTSMITFRLKRGEFGEFVTDYHQRKVIELFEKYDAEKTGMINAELAEGLQMGVTFHAGPELIERGKEFLAKEKDESGNIDLPTFIKYASIQVHPLLRDKVFKNALTEKYGIKHSMDSSAVGSQMNSP